MVSKKKILVLCSHEPYMDPRVVLVIDSLTKEYIVETIVVGQNVKKTNESQLKFKLDLNPNIKNQSKLSLNFYFFTTLYKVSYELKQLIKKFKFNQENIKNSIKEKKTIKSGCVKKIEIVNRRNFLYWIHTLYNTIKLIDGIFLQIKKQLMLDRMLIIFMQMIWIRYQEL